MFISNISSFEENNNELSTLRQLFMNIDTNQDGILNYDELTKAINTVLEDKNDQLKELFKGVDLD